MNTKPHFFLRDVIGNYLTELGQRNNKVTMVTADLVGTCRTKSFVDVFPERSFNMGIAEQNMVSFAAGLAHEGFIPYVFSMAPFISMRACEQCRTDVAYGNLNVRLVATYAGYSGGISGATHWALEDCAIMGSMAGMTVVELSDPIQAKKLMEKSLEFRGPIYIRTGVEPVKAIYEEDYQFEIGKASVVMDGNDGAFICSGVVVHMAMEAAIQIKQETDKRIRVVDMHTIKPIDEHAIISAAETGRIVVAQDHNIVGGLGYYVAAVLAQNGLAPQFKILGAPDCFVPMAHAGYLYHKFDFDTDGLRRRMLEMLK